jgi:hypothetical protein
MTPGELNDTNAVEVNGIRFETVMSNCMLIVPVKRSNQNDYTSVQLGFSITNNASNPYYFSFFKCFIPEIITSDGQNINGGCQADRVALPDASYLHLTMPRKSVTFSQTANCLWQQRYRNKRKKDRYLIFIMPFIQAEYLVFQLQGAGKYSIRFKYEVTNEEVKYYEDLIDKRCLEMVWLGQVFTPFIEFCIV